MSRKKILVLVENLAVPFDRRVWLEATTLRDAGYEIDVICPTSEQFPSHQEEIEGVRIHRYDLPHTGRGYFSYLREYAVAMYKTILLAWCIYQKHRFDVIHGCNPPDLFFAIALIFRPLGVRYVFDHHDLSPETFSVKYGKRKPWLHLLRLLERASFSTADVVLSTNGSLANIARQRGRVPPSKVFVVRTGPDRQRLYEVDPVPSLKRGRRYLACYLGVMAPQDGVDYALHAAAHLVLERKREDIHFAFLGTGESIDELRWLSSDLGLDGYAEFTGRVSDEVLREYLSTAEVCLSPDPANGLNEFHTMNKTLEYMAMGRAVVAFDLEETRCSAGDAAIYATPNDPVSFARCIGRLLDDADLRVTLGRQGRQRIRDSLGWEHTKHNLLEAYQAVTG